MMELLPSLTTSTPTIIGFLTGIANLYKSSLHLALICFKMLLNTPIFALLRVSIVTNYEGMPKESKNPFIFFLKSFFEITTTATIVFLSISESIASVQPRGSRSQPLANSIHAGSSTLIPNLPQALYIFSKRLVVNSKSYQL